MLYVIVNLDCIEIPLCKIRVPECEYQNVRDALQCEVDYNKLDIWNV